MVVKTRRGKRKENPTEEEAPRVKFVKTASGENLEKTTMEESETRAVEIVESTAKTTDESTAKMTDVSTEKTTDVLTEKMRKDSTEITAEITEPSNVAAEAAPTTLNKGPARPSPPAPPATPAIGTASGDEENEKPASGDEENEGFEEEQEEPDGENEDLNGNEAPEAIKPTRMFFNPSEYKKKIKLGTRCMIASAIKTLSNLKPKLSNAE
ncbi:nucleolin-like [Brassica napus]|uniref:nucleolin-like n=1 Tax=Brassica oleracea var. oleracea TaxID=109376 RepID=UPI0006A72376|nr:PREDICTED: nucleolin-like [Brassica oleracea var. oleracea]XP_048602086.1 nucleolin-like [Brassica napus]